MFISPNLEARNDWRYFDDGRCHSVDFRFCCNPRDVAAKKRTARAIAFSARSLHMVQLPAKVKDTIDRYLLALSRHNIPIREAILFGSYAKGTSQEWSDIDIALVSEIFGGDWISDKDKIRKITLSVSSEIEVLPFSPADFDSKNPFVKEILKTGIRSV
jgi:predicted nucleotidyltransferase